MVIWTEWFQKSMVLGGLGRFQGPCSRGGRDIKGGQGQPLFLPVFFVGNTKTLSTKGEKNVISTATHQPPHPNTIFTEEGQSKYTVQGTHKP